MRSIGCSKCAHFVAARGARTGGMPAEAQRARRRRRGVVRLCWRMLGLLQVLGVVRFWDPFCAPKIWDRLFSRGFWGEFFLIWGGGGLRGEGPVGV